MEKTKDDGQRSAYRDSLKRRNSAMRELLRMADKPMGEPQSDQRQAQTAAKCSPPKRRSASRTLKR